MFESPNGSINRKVMDSCLTRLTNSDDGPIHFVSLEEASYVKPLIELCCEGIAMCIYYNWIETIRQSRDERNDDFWYTHTQNAYQASIIANWNQLFGANGEEMHYKNLATLGNLAQYLKLPEDLTERLLKLKQMLLAAAATTEAEFDRYWHHVKPYRNEYLSHRKHKPEEDIQKALNKFSGRHPDVGPAYKMFKALYSIVLSMFGGMPRQRTEHNKFPLPSPKSTLAEVIEMFDNDLVDNPITTEANKLTKNVPY
jgi:hypothetical protein